LIITSAAYSANTSFLQYIMLFTLDNVPIYGGLSQTTTLVTLQTILNSGSFCPHLIFRKLYVVEIPHSVFCIPHNILTSRRQTSGRQWQMEYRQLGGRRLGDCVSWYSIMPKFHYLWPGLWPGFEQKKVTDQVCVALRPGLEQKTVAIQFCYFSSQNLVTSNGM